MKITSQIKKELSDFSSSYSLRADKKPNGETRLNLGVDDSYLYNQADTLELVDTYYRSEFTKSKKDDTGQRMFFINKIQFPVRVARKQVDIDLSNIILVPDTYSDAKKIRFVKKQFFDWGKTTYFGQTINDLLDDYTKYGTCVYRVVGQEIKKVDLHSIISSQKASSLKEAATSGGYFILEHDLYPKQMYEYPDWKVSGDSLKHDQQYKVYERFGLIHKDDLKEYNEEETDDEYTFGVTIIMQDSNGENSVLYMETMDEDDFAFGEAHYERIPNRWLGVGAAENELEHQVATNLTANLRRKGLIWASKKYFQSQDSEKDGFNLITESPDGAVIEVGANGLISQINTQSQHLGDFASMDEMINTNSRQSSFTFESVTGETLPSGTPFRLGVVTSSAANTFFNLKKEQFAIMLDKMFFEHVVEIFKTMPKEDIIKIAGSEEDVDDLIESMTQVKTDEFIKDQLLNTPVDKLLGMDLNKDKLQTEIKKKLANQPYYFIKNLNALYDNIHFSMTTEITGQNVDIGKETETLMTVLQLAMQNPQALNDERITKMIDLITSKTGQSVKSILGGVAQQSPELAGLANDAMTQQSLQGLTQPNAQPTT